MYLDFFIAIPILWGMFRGFKRGIIIELCTLMALVLGVYGAAAFGHSAQNYLESAYHTDPRISLVLAFSIVFLIIVAAVFIFGKILEKVIRAAALSLVNKIMGLLFGGLKFALVISGVFFILNGFPLTQNLISKEWKTQSILYSPIESVVHHISPVLQQLDFKEYIEKQIDEIKEKTKEL